MPCEEFEVLLRADSLRTACTDITSTRYITSTSSENANTMRTKGG
jgi:hypothetical protein